jgi:hypothetical protein
MHVSNRHMELSTVVAGIAHANGLVSRVNNRGSREGEEDAKYIFTSTVVISARAEADFGVLLEDEDWRAIEPPAGQRIWTDDYSNVIGAVIRQYRIDRSEEAAEDAPETPEPAPRPAEPAPAEQPPASVPPPPAPKQ